MQKLLSGAMFAGVVVFWLCCTGCGIFGAGGVKKPGKPDLIISSVSPKGKLRMGNCNTVIVTLKNQSKNHGKSTTHTVLEVRKGKKNLAGPTVYTSGQDVWPVRGKTRKKLTFRGVRIPLTEEPSWYTLKAIADRNNDEEEFREDNNTRYRNKFVDEQCD